MKLLRKFEKGILANHGFSLLETTVYVATVMILIGVGLAATYRSMDNSAGFRRSTGDIVRALQVGETWRNDVRSAREVQLETNAPAGEQILILHGPDRDISYRFAEHVLYRRNAANDWTPVIQNVAASEFVSDPRRELTAWRWEVELQTHRKQLGSVRPLFTFIAVPRSPETP